jgi:hypothetical protein
MGNQPFLYNIPDSAYDNKTGAGSYQVSKQASSVAKSGMGVGVGVG